MRWPNWMQRFKRGAGDGGSATEDGQLPLREFVYLDEVSVYSLLASTTGGIQTEQTETATTSRTRRVDAAGGGNVGLARAELSTGMESSASQGIQVLRKSIVQATFKELIELESNRLLLRDGAAPPTPPPTAESLAAAAELDPEARGYHLVPGAALERGQLLELEVELNAEAIFLARRVISTMLEFFQEIPEFFEVDRKTFEQGRAVETMLRRMLVGLVPIRARCTNYRLVSISGTGWLVSTAMLESSSDLLAQRAKPLYVVGVAEEGLFWRDIRRVLFSGSRYFMMCRIAAPGVRTKWTPVKLAEIFKTFAPQVAEVMDQAGRSFLDGVAAGAAQSEEEPHEAADVLARIAARLAEEVNDEWTEEDQAALLDTVDLEDLARPEARRAAVEPIVATLEARSGTKLAPERLVDIRYEEFATAQVDDSTDGAEAKFSASAVEGSDLLIDTEIVAIYW